MEAIHVSRENQLLLDLCKFQSDPFSMPAASYVQSMNLPYLLGQILCNRLGGVAYDALSASGVLSMLNREFRNPLTQIYRQNRKQAESFLNVEAYLAKLFQNAAFPYAFLKGAYLVQLYKLGLRTSNDFDILILPEDLTKVEAILAEAGFVQGEIRDGRIQEASRAQIISSRMNRGETVPWLKACDLPEQPFIEIDLNFSLDFQAKDERQLVKKMLLNAQPLIHTAKGNLYTLAPVDFLIHLCAHLYKEATVINWVKMGRDLTLYKFVDIYLLLSISDGSFLSDALADTIKLYGMEKECYYAVEKTGSLFGMDSEAFIHLQNTIRPADITYLKQIYSPRDKKVYQYDMPFTNWVFTPNRASFLKEVL